MFALSIMTKRFQLGVTAIVAFLPGATVCVAQRPAPQTVEYGLPATGEIVHGRMVQWDYWGLRAETCQRTATGVECTLAVMNGSADDHAICVGDAALVHTDATDSTKMTSVRRAPRPPAKGEMEKKGYDCLQVPAHGDQKIRLRSMSVGAGRPVDIRITLIERLRQPGKDSTFAARAKVPIGWLAR